jgi:hypothetical protein
VRTRRNLASAVIFARICVTDCTISRQVPVKALHSIENPILTNLYFPLTQKIEGVKPYSFFDSFLSFSGWCGVRGSSEVTVLAERLRWRASKGL